MENDNIKIFIDESGNTGHIGFNQKGFNFGDQEFFVLGAVVVNSESQSLLLNKYREFKKHFNISGELKGSSLLTRKNNDKLNYFLENILNNKDFYINIYGKVFYLSTFILNWLRPDLLIENPILFYRSASLLSLEDKEIFQLYYDALLKRDINSVKNFLEKFVNSKFHYFDNNEIINYSSWLLENHKLEVLVDDLMDIDFVDKSIIVNPINLTAFGELYECVKEKYNKKNCDISVIHDNINTYDKLINKYMGLCGVTVTFKDSQTEEMIQIADNIVGIIQGLFVKVHKMLDKKELFHDKNSWLLNMFTKMLNKIGFESVKLTVPMSDISAIKAIVEMINSNIEKNICNFNFLYQIKQHEYFLNLSCENFDPVYHSNKLKE